MSDDHVSDLQLSGPIESQRLLRSMYIHRAWTRAVCTVAVAGAWAALFFASCPGACS